jgi:DNA-binding NtrC family response regulator
MFRARSQEVTEVGRMGRRQIVVVDDDAQMRDMLADILREEGYDVDLASDGKEALELLSRKPCDVVISDIRMNGMDGIELLGRMHDAHPDVPVLMVTAFGSIDTAIESIKAGAFHFITKPFKIDDVVMMVERALADRALRDENLRLRKEVSRRYAFGSIIGRSKAMADLFALVELVAAGHSTVLIFGESGTGKELVARAIHYNGPRAKKPFIPLNCAAIPEGLLESELFGHVRGSFTGAVANKRGLIVDADGGTLFLDEIGDMPLPLQAKLLRVLQERRVRPVGGNQDVAVDVRIITATHRDLKVEARAGRFREDLFYRLSVIPLHLPSLRERRDDIPLLADHFLTRFATDTSVPRKTLSPDAQEALLRYHWPGNVRELENVMERLTVLTRGAQITPADLPPAIRGVEKAGHGIDLDRHMTLEELERDYVIKILREVGGNKERAARILGVNRRTLTRWESRYHLKAALREGADAGEADRVGDANDGGGDDDAAAALHDSRAGPP